MPRGEKKVPFFEASGHLSTSSVVGEAVYVSWSAGRKPWLKRTCRQSTSNNHHSNAHDHNTVATLEELCDRILQRVNYNAAIDSDTMWKYPNNGSCEEANVPSDTKPKAQTRRTVALHRKSDLLSEERHLSIEGMKESETCQTSHPQNSPSSNNSNTTNTWRIAPVRKRGKACNVCFLPRCLHQPVHDVCRTDACHMHLPKHG